MSSKGESSNSSTVNTKTSKNVQVGLRDKLEKMASTLRYVEHEHKKSYKYSTEELRAIKKLMPQIRSSMIKFAITVDNGIKKDILSQLDYQQEAITIFNQTYSNEKINEKIEGISLTNKTLNKERLGSCIIEIYGDKCGVCQNDIKIACLKECITDHSEASIIKASPGPLSLLETLIFSVNNNKGIKVDKYFNEFYIGKETLATSILAAYAGKRIEQKLHFISSVLLTELGEVKQSKETSGPNPLDDLIKDEFDCYINRTVNLTALGRVYSEIENSRTRETQFLKEGNKKILTSVEKNPMTLMRKNGQLIEQKMTKSCLQQVFETVEDNIKYKLQYNEPNMQTIISDVVKTSGDHLSLIDSHVIVVREVRLREKRSRFFETIDTFLEPVLLTIKRKSKQNQTENESEETQTQNDVNELKQIKNTKLHQIRVFYLSKLTSIQTRTAGEEMDEEESEKQDRVIKSVVINTNQLKHAMTQIRREMAYEKVFSILSTEDQLNKMPHIIDRGLASKIYYDVNDETSRSPNFIEVKEYAMNSSVAKNLILETRLKAAVIKDRFKSETVIKDKDSARYSIYYNFKEKIADDNISCQFTITREYNSKNYEEEIVNPSLKSILSWIYNQPNRNKFNGQKYYISSDQNTEFILRPHFVMSKIKTNNTENEEELEDETKGFFKTLVKLVSQSREDQMSKIKAVDSLKNYVKDKDLLKLNGIYSIAKNRIFYQGNSVVEEIEKNTKSSRRGSGKGKNIFKFALFSNPGRFLADLEIKHECFTPKIESDLKEVNIKDCCKVEFINNKDFCEKPLDMEIRITETPLIRKVETIVALSENKAIKMVMTEPNILTILCHRTLMSNEKEIITSMKSFIKNRLNFDSIDDYFDINKGISYKVFKKNSTDIHEKSCPHYNFGLFGVKSKVEFYEIERNLVHTGEDEDEKLPKTYSYSQSTLTHRTDFKIVRVACRCCEIASTLLFNSDTMSDTITFTMPREILSPIDVAYAIDKLLHELARCSTEDEEDKFVERFKHRIQRCMMHDVKVTTQEEDNKAKIEYIDAKKNKVDIDITD